MNKEVRSPFIAPLLSVTSSNVTSLHFVIPKPSRTPRPLPRPSRTPRPPPTRRGSATHALTVFSIAEQSVRRSHPANLEARHIGLSSVLFKQSDGNDLYEEGYTQCGVTVAPRTSQWHRTHCQARRRTEECMSCPRPDQIQTLETRNLLHS